MDTISIPNHITDVNQYLWKALQAMITAENAGQLTLPGPTKTRPVLVRGNERVELFRRHDDRLVFVYRNRGQWKFSNPLAHLGRDDNHISGPRAIWKLMTGERYKFDQWAQVLH